MAKGGGKRGSTSVWAKVKFDRKIVAIAKVVGAEEIYYDDSDIEKFAKQANIKVVRLGDLPLPAEDRQMELKLEGHPDADTAAPKESDESQRKDRPQRPPDDFVSVARRLEADEDKGRFEAMLKKIAKAKVK